MNPKMVTVHCTASPNGRIVTINDIDRWHKERGFSKCGYHRVIYVDGSIARGRDYTETGAHVHGHNSGNIGIALVGNDLFKRAQFESLRWLFKEIENLYRIDLSRWSAHNEFDSAKLHGKTCPNISGADLRKIVSGDNEVMSRYLLAQ